MSFPSMLIPSPLCLFLGASCHGRAVLLFRRLPGRVDRLRLVCRHLLPRRMLWTHADSRGAFTSIFLLLNAALWVKLPILK